jgi:hypothetical protein
MLTLFWRNKNSPIDLLSNDLLAEQATVFRETIKSFIKLTDMLKAQLIVKIDLGLYVVDCTKLAQ